jgi:hypothetical protein
MQEAPAEGRCRYCGGPLEQPPSGGRQKLFCSDEHRVRYWRERRRQGLPTGEEDAKGAADVRTLSWELQATLLGLERTVGSLARALSEAGDLDATRAIREQAEAESQRRIAAAEERRARAERMRLDAEAMAEAANAAAREAQERAERLGLEAEQAREAAAVAEAQARGAQARADERIATAGEELRGQRAAIEAGARGAMAVSEERAQQAERLLGQAIELRDAAQHHNRELERGLAEVGQRLQAAEQRRQGVEDARERETGELRDRLEHAQQDLRRLEADGAAQQGARIEAEQQARAFAQLAEERALERDRVLRLLDQVGAAQVRRSTRRSATRPAAAPE